MAQKRLHARVHGMVQGVFFRANTEDVATGLGLTGWVCNMPDGSVAVLAEGDEERLKQLLTWLNRGPRHARVDRVDADWSEGTGRHRYFQTVYRPPQEG